MDTTMETKTCSKCQVATRCNRMLGWMGESVRLLRRAIAYLEGAV